MTQHKDPYLNRSWGNLIHRKLSPHRLIKITQFPIYFHDLPFTIENVDDPDVYEGDMILTPEQRIAADLGMDVDNPLGRGSTVGRQWPSGLVPYVIDDRLGKLKSPSLLFMGIVITFVNM